MNILPSPFSQYEIDYVLVSTEAMEDLRIPTEKYERIGFFYRVPKDEWVLLKGVP